MKDKTKGVIARLKSSEGGFTLIEMLIVVGIIVALAAAIVPQVVQFGGKGTEGQSATEQASLQTAIDSMLADKGLSSVTANTQSKNAFSSVITGLGTVALYDTYISTATTTSFYCWNSKGKITKQLVSSAANDC